MKFDLIIAGGQIVDPVNKQHGIFDIGISAGKITAIAEELDVTAAKRVLSGRGKLIIPGIIDLHTHLSARHHGALGHKMLALAGVTTTIEISGPIDSVLAIAKTSGVGLNMAMLDQVHPGVTVENNNPKAREINALFDKVLQQGGIGLKMLGGHFPLTPDSIATTIEIAANKLAYIAFHAGSTKTGSNLQGCLEAIELANGNPLHLAHINSYCRGYIKPCYQEAEAALAALAKNPNIRAESYLSAHNGCTSYVINGKVESKVTAKCLELAGYDATMEGLKAAIIDGWAKYNITNGGINSLACGEEIAAIWQKNKTVGSVSFPVNPIDSRVKLAIARHNNNEFVIDAIATDGGGFPRNVIIENGFALITLGGLTIDDFVKKTSVNPAKWLGLTNKGHLGLGADADITVIDPMYHNAWATIVNGKIIMNEGNIMPQKTTIITTKIGAKFIANQGLPTLIIDLKNTGYFTGKI